MPAGERARAAKQSSDPWRGGNSGDRHSRPSGEATRLQRTLLPRVVRGAQARAGGRVGVFRRRDRTRQELAAMRDYLQSVIEQKDAANEELRSASEEMLSSNEELRSTNEEMETAKEELQSVNEELVTVNEQLMNRNLELTRVSDDVTNLLGSANVPMLAVGVDLRIRWFTPSAGKVLSLLPTDLGRPIDELRMLFDLSELEALITEVIDSVQTEEREVRYRDGHWYMLRIRPYRTAENKIDGAVVVLAD